MSDRSDQKQFLEVIDRDEAHRRFREALGNVTQRREEIDLADALGRVLLEDVVAEIDVPNFDRSNVDGFAVRAADTWGADEEAPVKLELIADDVITPGAIPELRISPGETIAIATGAPIPRGADAVVMVEYTDREGTAILVRRPVTPGGNLTFAGTDITRGETVVRAGELLTARETGVLAAIGTGRVIVAAKPVVAILSTGDELVPPGGPIRSGEIYDSNSRILADTVRELGGEPRNLGIARDDEKELSAMLDEAMSADVILFSGGTSKGAGDLSYRVVEQRGEPGIVVHGVALKPGKPICLAVAAGKPIIILPGFPTSAIFTFHEFVAPLIRELGGLPESPEVIVEAKMPFRVTSEKGRTEYLLVGLVSGAVERELPTAYPMGKGSGSVTTFSRADGFLTIGRQQEYVDEGDVVEVRLLGRGVIAADLVAIGSHCVGLDEILSALRRDGFRSKILNVGSSAGLSAAKRGECDVAGVHLFDRRSGTYNEPFLTDELVLIRGYDRVQGIAHRPDDRRFAGRSVEEAMGAALEDPSCVMVNRNRGSGTRAVIDELLGDARPDGYPVESKSHHAVAASVAQGRADWGVCIETVAREAGLAFIPVKEERYDFIIPRSRIERAPVQRFIEIVRSEAMRERLAARGFSRGSEPAANITDPSTVLRCAPAAQDDGDSSVRRRKDERWSSITAGGQRARSRTLLALNVAMTGDPCASRSSSNERRVIRAVSSKPQSMRSRTSGSSRATELIIPLMWLRAEMPECRKVSIVTSCARIRAKADVACISWPAVASSSCFP